MPTDRGKKRFRMHACMIGRYHGILTTLLVMVVIMDADTAGTGLNYVKSAVCY